MKQITSFSPFFLGLPTFVLSGDGKRLTKSIPCLVATKGEGNLKIETKDVITKSKQNLEGAKQKRQKKCGGGAVQGVLLLLLFTTRDPSGHLS